MPRAIDLMRDARLAEARRIRLETANHELAALYTKVKALDSLKTQFFAPRPRSVTPSGGTSRSSPAMPAHFSGT
ncbi:MAG: hypothetical protein E6J75_05865 [Deltaproteobacteria bacterium]|nr:MAG: hypothetical protein E6J75_05865 [Deltaproteobacteria bacterium]